MQVQQLEREGVSPEKLKELLGRGRAKKGMFEGNTVEGELEIGQVASMINSIESVDHIMKNLISEFNGVSCKMNNLKL